MIPKIMNPQNDFSSGQLNADAKRSDDPLVKAGTRQCINARILNSRKVTNRPGRTALFPTDGRVDEVTVSPGLTFRLCFGNGTLKIRDATGAVVSGEVGYAWTIATAGSVIWTLISRDVSTRDVIMTFPGQRVKIARYTVATASWSFLNFTFNTASGAFSEPFYRLAPGGIRLEASDKAGVISLVTDVPYFTPGMVGNVIRWINHQITITGYISPTTVSALVIENLPNTSQFNLSSVVGSFNVGDIITKAGSNITAEVTIFSGSDITFNFLKTGDDFGVAPFDIVGPNGTATTSGGATPHADSKTVIWDEEVVNDNRGWPQSCFSDQNRLGFCDIPSLPSAIMWSNIGVYDAFLPGPFPTDAIFELAPNRCRVYHIVNKSDEFVLTDKGIWYIPMSTSNPLKPGSVQFLAVSSDPAARIKPVVTTRAIVYVNGSLNRVDAILPKSGSLYIPWSSEETSLYHSALFNSPVAIAAVNPTSFSQEEYIHVLNADGTMVVGKFDVGKEWAGWVPWNGNGFINWISSVGQDLLLTTTYTGSAPVTVAEKMDGGQYMDGAVLANNIPAGMVVGGKGAFWHLAGGSVDLMDGRMWKGVYQIDANGFIIPNEPGEDLTSLTLNGGKAWTFTLEPFIAQAQGGQDVQQRIRRRKIARAAVSVQNSTGGFTFCNRIIPPYNAGDDQSQPPPLRETTYTFRPRGRSYDPRVPLVKTMPGPLTVLELGFEVTV